jgi:hypothetical protein
MPDDSDASIEELLARLKGVEVFRYLSEPKSGIVGDISGSQVSHRGHRRYEQGGRIPGMEVDEDEHEEL